jgi:hypothetical protein
VQQTLAGVEEQLDLSPQKKQTYCTEEIHFQNGDVHRHPTGLQANIAKTHIYQKKTAWIATPPHELDNRNKVEAVTGK